MKEKIYLIPGLMTDERLWSKVLPLLEDKYEFIHIPISNSSNFDEIIKDILPLFEEEKINLLGFSLGGYISSYITMLFPDKINKLFLLAATPGGTSQKEIERRKKKLEIIENEGFSNLSYEKTKLLVEKKNDEDTIKIIRNMYSDLGKETFISQLSATFNRIDLSEQIKKLNLPIFLYYSKDDRLVNKSSIKILDDNVENIKVLAREGTSHNISLEDPLSLSKQIIRWMNI